MKANISKNRFLLTAVSFLVSIQLAQNLSASEVVSLVNEDFENSNIYWTKINNKSRSSLDIPFYFNVPFKNFTQLPENIISSRISNKALAPVIFNYRETSRHRHQKDPASSLGLRMIIVNGEKSRLENSKSLGESGVFETGDIVLSFRKEWFKTLKYSHIQLGISHAGILYLDTRADGSTYLRNIDMPFDQKHVAEGYLDSDHYQKAPLLHVIRAKNLTEQQKQNLNAWIKRIATAGKSAYQKGILKFNQDYSNPRFREDEPLKFVGDLGRIALGLTINETLMNYCSEFVWSILSLRDCDPTSAEVKMSFQTEVAPSCLKPIFNPMPVLGSIVAAQDKTSPELTVGLADGVPLIAQNLVSTIQKPDEKNQAIDILISKAVFKAANNTATNISSGHRSVEEGILSKNPKFFDLLLQYFTMVNNSDAEQNPMIPAMQQGFNSAQLPNYSPTSYMVHALLPNESSIKSMDYVGTIVYGQKVDGKVNSHDYFKGFLKLIQ